MQDSFLPWSSHILKEWRDSWTTVAQNIGSKRAFNYDVSITGTYIKECGEILRCKLHSYR